MWYAIILIYIVYLILYLYYHICQSMFSEEKGHHTQFLKGASRLSQVHRELSINEI